MSVTRLSVPLDFQNNGLNCQSLTDMILEEFSDHDRRQIIGSVLTMEWDFDDEDDAKGMREDIMSSLEQEGVVLSPEEPNFSGVRVDVYDEEGRVVHIPDDEEEEEEDEDYDDDPEDEEDEE